MVCVIVCLCKCKYEREWVSDSPFSMRLNAKFHVITIHITVAGFRLIQMSGFFDGTPVLLSIKHICKYILMEYRILNNTRNITPPQNYNYRAECEIMMETMFTLCDEYEN